MPVADFRDYAEIPLFFFEVGERSSAGVLESLSIVDAVADFRDYAEIPLFP